VVTLLCDGGERYGHTYYDDTWVATQGMDLAPYHEVLDRFLTTGEWTASAHGEDHAGGDGPDEHGKAGVA
jgi:cysteine synthase